MRGGFFTRVRYHKNVPFTEADIDHFKITHDEWDWLFEK